MGILNLGGGSGLLGLGGIGGVSSTGALGTMGGLLDPQEMKKQQIKNAMLQAGISLMTNGGIGEAAGAGLLWNERRAMADVRRRKGAHFTCWRPDLTGHSSHQTIKPPNRPEGRRMAVRHQSTSAIDT